MGPGARISWTPGGEVQATSRARRAKLVEPRRHGNCRPAGNLGHSRRFVTKRRPAPAPPPRTPGRYDETESRTAARPRWWYTCAFATPGESGRPPCHAAQPQGRKLRASSKPPPRHHRPERIGKVLAGFRYDLRRRTATVRRIPLGVRSAVPRSTPEAPRREHRRAEPRDRHRAKRPGKEPALDGRHGHGDSGLPAPTVRAGGSPPLPEVRTCAHGLHRPGDRRRHHRSG